MPQYDLAALPGDITVQPSVDGSNTTLNAADNAAGAGGAIAIGAGDGQAAVGGDISIRAGQSNGDANNGGAINLVAGAGADQSAGGAVLQLFGGYASQEGGDVLLKSGDAGDVSNGGNIILRLGIAFGEDAVAGNLMLEVPTADPHVPGAAYWNAGVLTKSAG